MKISKQAYAKRNRIYLKDLSLPGKLIVLEGNDGSGKSSTAKLLSKYLNGCKVKNRILKFNMSSVTIKAIKIGKQRTFGPHTNTFLHATSILDQLERFAIYELAQGKTIICDRYIYSIIARGIVRGVNETNIFTLLDWFPKPDIVFFLDIHPQDALERIGLDNITFWEAGGDVIYSKSYAESFIDFQTKVRDVFLRYKDTWCFNIIDANQSQRAILNTIINMLKDIYGS